MVDEKQSMSSPTCSTEMQTFKKHLTMKEITLLREWNEFTKTYEWLHFKSYTYFKYINYGLMIPIIILTSMSGSASIILSSISSSDCHKDKIDYPQLVVGFTTIVAAILTTIYNFVKVPEFQQRHLTHSSDFNKLSREIEMELVLFETKHKTYSSLEEFIKTMRTRLDRFIESAPPIPNKVLRSFCSSHQNTPHCKPLLPTALNYSITMDSTKEPTTSNSEESPVDDQDDQDVSIQVVDQPTHFTSLDTKANTDKGLTTSDAIKNIEELKLQWRRSNDFERFMRDMKLRTP